MPQDVYLLEEDLQPSRKVFFFFLFIQSSYVTYLDHVEGPLRSICTVRFLTAVHV